MTEPEWRVVDARSTGMDEGALRAWARAQRPAAHVSRSYRYPYCLIAWHDEPVGVDIERIEPYDVAFAASICTPFERVDAERVAEAGAWLASLWCSKEALSKALGAPLRYDPRRLESPIGWPGGRAGAWRARPLEVVPGHVAWVCWRSPTRVRDLPLTRPAVSVTI